MTDLDLVKRGLDNIIESSQAKTSQGKYTPFGNAVVKLKNDLLEKLDDATKDIETGASIYKQARSAYAGPSQLISSAELGRTIFSKDAGAISDAVKGMTESEFKAFQIELMRICALLPERSLGKQDCLICGKSLRLKKN